MADRVFIMDRGVDQQSVSSESVSSKSLTYDDNSECNDNGSVSSTCNSIITNFNCFSFEDLPKVTLNDIPKEKDDVDFFDDSVTEIPEVQNSSVSHLDKTIEAVVVPAVSNDTESHTNTNCKSNGNSFNHTANTSHLKYKTYGYNHKRLNYRHNNYQRSNYHRNNYYQNNYYRRPFYNNYRQFEYLNGYQNHKFCNKWDCEMRHRQNQHFRSMLFRGIFHFTKVLEYLASIDL